MGQQKRALITGITGQDGSYMAEFLLERGYEVFGIVRPKARASALRLEPIVSRLRLLTADLTDQASLDRAVQTAVPDEVYNLAAESFLPNSWDDPTQSGDVTGLGAARLLASLRRYRPGARFCQASSAQIFGNPTETPQTEGTPVRPVTPYGAAKAYAHFMTASYRASGSLYACSAILFNHESPRRGPEFVTRKITQAVAKIKLGLEKELRLGALDSRRDWGFAGDYVKGMWLMLQQPAPDDFILATGVARSVREWLDRAFQCVGLNADDYLVSDSTLLRPSDAKTFVGDPGKAVRTLGWKHSVGFDQLVELMVQEDLRLLSESPAARR